jgi:phosphate starvation-inducible protein PhoH and related proteins
MTEKIIYFDAVEPVDIYGANNINIKKMQQLFPKLKVIARGNEIKVLGEKSEISKFESKIQKFISHVEKYNQLTSEEIDKILLGSHEPKQDEQGKPENAIIFGNNGKPIKAQTPNQKALVKNYEENDLMFAVGPAGTGKTYTAIALAVRAFKNKEVKRIVLSRPAVEAGENLGFLPGDMKEKLDPYLQALYDALYDMIPAKRLTDLMTQGLVQIAPLAYMRGRTLNNAFVILDEAQNATSNQLKMFLTRMGKSSKFIVTGDITQIDLPRRNDSGLIQCLRILKNINGISILFFDERDIIRHRLVKFIIEAYDKDESGPEGIQPDNSQ